jgi:hypothetical protein
MSATLCPIVRSNFLHGKQQNLPHEFRDPKTERIRSRFSLRILRENNLVLCPVTYGTVTRKGIVD